MAVQLTDEEIQRLISEPKPLPADFRRRMSSKPKHGHNEGEISITGAAGSEFYLILRQASCNPLDFSVILGYKIPQSNRIFRLCRYNGKHGEHTNKLEGQTFYGFHIHRATERYQEMGFKEDAYAEPTDRYSDFSGAIECALQDGCFVGPASPQGQLF